jgi:hypothetical protein
MSLITKNQITIVNVDDGVPGPVGPRGASSIGLGFKLNYSTFYTQNYGEIYVHGFDDTGLASDVNGFIYYQETKISVTKGMVNPNVPVDSFLCIPKSGGAVSVCTYDYQGNTFKDLSNTLIDESLYIAIGTIKNDEAEHTETAELFPYGKSFSDVRKDLIAKLLFSSGLTGSDFQAMVENLDIQAFNYIATLTLFAQNLIANEAFLDTLSAAEAFFQSIWAWNVKSMNYAETNGFPTSGYKFEGGDGSIRAVNGTFVNADLINANVTGSFTSEEFATQKPGNEVIVTSNPAVTSYWDKKYLYNALGDSFVFSSGTCNGIAITSIDNFSYAVPRGLLDYEDTLTIHLANGTSRDYTVLFSNSNPTYPANLNTDVLLINGTVSFASNTILLVSGSDFYTSFASVAQGFAFAYTGTVTVATLITAAKVKVTTNGVYFYSAEMVEISFVDKNSYYSALSCTISIESSIAGIKTKHILAADHDTYDIGSSAKRFKTIYGSKVYGAVGNDIIDWIETPGDWKLGFAHIYNGHYFGIPSDTFSIAAGENKQGKMPRAIAGFVLCFVDSDYPINTPLTYKKDGTLTKKRWWMRTSTVATYYSKPRTFFWNRAEVDGRHVVKVVM